MIKPSDLPPDGPRYTEQQLVYLEKRFDAAISLACSTGRWPAQVLAKRDAMPYSAIVVMGQRYREAGWVVEIPSRGEPLVWIYRP